MLSTVKHQKEWTLMVAQAQADHANGKKPKMVTFGQVWRQVSREKGKINKKKDIQERLDKLIDLGYVKTRKRKKHATYGVTDDAREKWKEVRKLCP